jgi:hypothetical protein
VTRRDAVTHPETHEKRAPNHDERVSLHGPSYEEVLAGLLKVDPKQLDTEEGEKEQ